MDFTYDDEADEYRCPGGRALKPYWRDISKGRPEFGKDGFKRYFARREDCRPCLLKPLCTPNQATRKISRSRHESARQAARNIATTDAYVASSYARRKVEMLFAHLKRILKLDIKDFSRRIRDENGLWKGFGVEIGEGAVLGPLIALARGDHRERVA